MMNAMVVTGATLQHVGARVPLNRVAAAASLDRVRAAAALQDTVARRADEGVLVGARFHGQGLRDYGDEWVGAAIRAY